MNNTEDTSAPTVAEASNLPAKPKGLQNVIFVLGVFGFLAVCFGQYLLPKSADQHVHDGWIATINERYDQALRELDAAIKKEPKHVRAYVLRAEVNLKQNRLPAAREDLKKALELEPNNVNAMTLLARLTQAPTSPSEPAK